MLVNHDALNNGFITFAHWAFYESIYFHKYLPNGWLYWRRE